MGMVCRRAPMKAVRGALKGTGVFTRESENTSSRNFQAAGSRSFPAAAGTARLSAATLLGGDNDGCGREGRSYYCLYYQNWAEMSGGHDYQCCQGHCYQMKILIL